MHKNGYFSLLFHWLFILFIVAPLVVVMAMAFTDKGYLSLPTDGLSLRWFRALLENQEMLDAFVLSLKLGLVSATVATLLAVPAALAISRYEFPGRGALTGFLLSPLDRKSTRLNSSHGYTSSAVFCLKKKSDSHLATPMQLQQYQSSEQGNLYTHVINC